MNRAVGSNSMHKVGSGKYIVLNVKNCWTLHTCT
jgi:hypothetical protein